MSPTLRVTGHVKFMQCEDLGDEMTNAEIVAYLGAAAWLPHIIPWIYRLIVKPKLRIIPNVTSEIGFTRFGPIFNLRMAFICENRNLIVDGLELHIRHSDGEGRVFKWAGLAETFSEITDSTGNRQIVSKDQTPIAIKVLTDSFTDKLVRFQEPKFITADTETTRNLVNHFNFLKQRNPKGFVSEVLESKEYYDVINYRKNWFWWKTGRYEVTIKPTSPEKFRLREDKFAFELVDIDIRMLERNFQAIEIDLKNVINSNIVGAIDEICIWQWVNPQIVKV